MLVAVGYADTEGRSPAGTCADCFPSPWCGSLGVQFIGSSTNYDGNSTDLINCRGGDWDGGGILVTNAGTSPINLTGLTVTLPLPASGDVGTPSCAEPPRPITFDLWFGQQNYFGNPADPAYYGGPILVPPGGQAIFAGTSSDGSYTCPTGNYPSGPRGSPNATYDFDTSDANFLSGCTPTTDTASDPQITFTAVGYAPTTYIDKGHTLDTGGIDTGNCPPTQADPQWGHEYLGWRLVNSTCGEACPMNQFSYPLTTSPGEAVTESASLAVAPGQTTQSQATVTGASLTTYGVVGVVAVLVVVSGYLVLRVRRGRPGGRPA